MRKMPKTMAEIADTVIVGNIIYEDFKAALVNSRSGEISFPLRAKSVYNERTNVPKGGRI